METKKTQIKRKFVSLAEARPDLAKEWNYEKNGDLRPEDVSCGSNKKVWWIYHYAVPDDYPVELLRGKNFDFEWEAKVYARNEYPGCPFLNGHSIWTGFNDLATINPELAAQWHPTKNGDLKPTQVTANSGLKVWWSLPYDIPLDYPIEPLRGKHFKFEWEASIDNRNKHQSCPYLIGKAVWPGFNDLATTNPELAAQWHPIKNGDLKPTQVTANSGYKVWWLLHYDIPNDYFIESLKGKHFDFEWESTIANRSSGFGCPFLSGRAIWPGFNDLATTNPELAAQWHPTKNGDLKPTQVTANTHKKVWWLLPYDVPIDYPVEYLRDKHFDFEWQATIYNRNNGTDCPYLTGNAIWPGFNDLATTNPELAAQWHTTKNGDLKPAQATVSTDKKVWWLLSYDVPIDYPVEYLRGKHFDFEWKASINSRNRGTGCPYLAGKAVWPGFNDLATTNPELAAQWHPTKNGDLRPTQVTANSNRKVWWLYPYDDPNTGKHSVFEWQATVYNRNNGTDCPYLTMYKGEEYIKQYLQENNTVYYAQQKFSNLFGINNGKLSYDFAIPDVKSRFILIEYNGIQHYESDEFFGGEEQFKKQQEHDRRKREYAKQHGYKLITIKYTHDTYEKVAEYLDKHLPKRDCKKIPKKAA